MEPVYNEQYKCWVHSGTSGLWDLTVAKEMIGTRFYYHLPIKNPEPVIVDVGGHIGLFSRFYAEEYPTARIFYIEPHPDNFALAALNLNNYPNVTLIQGAVTYEKNVAFWPYTEGTNSGGSQLVKEGELPFDNNCTNWKSNSPLPILTLEELQENYQLDFIDLLKLDCEGSEFSILKNCNLERINRIVGEWHHGPNFRDLRFSHLMGFRFDPHSPIGGPLGNFSLWNRKWNNRSLPTAESSQHPQAVTDEVKDCC